MRIYKWEMQKKVRLFVDSRSFADSHRLGQSIIEILIAIAIGGLIIGSAVTAIRLSLRTGTQTQSLRSATPLIGGLIDSAKSSAEGDWNTIYGLDKTGCPEACPKYYFARDNGLKIVQGEEGVLGEDIVSGLVGYWKFDEAGITAPTNIAYDASANNNKGTINGTIISPPSTPPTQAGVSNCKVGGCFNFDGSTNYIGVGNPSSLQITGDQTIAMWINPSDPQGLRRNPYAKAYGGEGAITMEIDGTLSYYYGTAGGNGAPYQRFDNGSAIPLSQWTHIAIVRDLTNMKLYWYKNGAQTSFSPATYSAGTASSLNAFIGKGYTNNFLGSIDDVRIYNRALTAAEVTQLYGSKIYTRSFSIDDVGRTSCGRGDISSSAIAGCTDGSQISEDPSTQKITATVTPVGGTALTATEYLIRSKNSATIFTDWSGVADTSGTPYTSPTNNYSDKNNIDNYSVPGSIKLPD